MGQLWMKPQDGCGKEAGCNECRLEARVVMPLVKCTAKDGRNITNKYVIAIKWALQKSEYFSQFLM
jgi:hypothetical protein